MSIDITVQTVTTIIKNLEGDAGYGSVSIRPAQAFQYNDGGIVIVGTEAVIATIVDGKLVGSLVLHPTVGATHFPETYYIVEYDIDSDTFTEFWELKETPLTIEWSDIPRIVENGEAQDLILVHEAKVDPHSQYLRRDETFEASPGAGAMPDGKGPSPRAKASDGFLESSFLNPADNPTNADQLVAIITAFTTLTQSQGQLLLNEIDAHLKALEDGAGALGALSLLDTVDTAQVDDNAITLAKIAHGAASLVYQTDPTGIPILAALAAAALPSHNHLLADVTDSGDLAGKNTVATSDINNLAVTNAKIANTTLTDAKFALIANHLALCSRLGGQPLFQKLVANHMTYGAGSLAIARLDWDLGDQEIRATTAFPGVLSTDEVLNVNILSVFGSGTRRDYQVYMANANTNVVVERVRDNSPALTNTTVNVQINLLKGE